VGRNEGEAAMNGAELEQIRYMVAEATNQATMNATRAPTAIDVQIHLISAVCVVLCFAIIGAVVSFGFRTLRRPR
jgi:hypothetical protein